MSFYITLPSNSSMDLYPNNTLTNYTTQLPIPLKFDVPYEVALVEMIFRQSWTVDLGLLEFHDKNDIFRLKIEANDGDMIVNIIDNINIELEKYYLENIKKQMTEIGANPETIFEQQSIMKKSINLPKLLYYNSLLKFQCEPDTYFQFKGPIRGLLELIQDWYSSNVPPVIVNRTRLHYVEALYVYCDIIELQFTGDTKSQLLRTVVVSNSYHSIVAVSYENPHYVPVNQNHINTINIDIRSDTGYHIHFLDGKVIVKLHFRPMRYGL